MALKEQFIFFVDACKPYPRRLHRISLLRRTAAPENPFCALIYQGATPTGLECAQGLVVVFSSTLQTFQAYHFYALTV
jgi:hypothetical protein